MKINVSTEIRFRTARSGGKGGQNVNKVETMVEGYFNIAGSRLLSTEQKERIIQKLQNRINSEGDLLVKSQVHRSQLSNKQEVVRKINQLLFEAIKQPQRRIATKPSVGSKKKRLESKKRHSIFKKARQKISRDEF